MIFFITLNIIIMILISCIAWKYIFSSIHIKKNYGNIFNHIVTLYSVYSLLLIMAISNKRVEEFYLIFFKFFKFLEIPCLIIYIVIGQILYRKHKEKINELIKLNQNKKWKESKSDILNRLNLYKSIKVMESEKRELIKLNNSIIFKYFPFFKRKYNCKNIQQVCFILNLQYGEYEKSWKVQDIKINENLCFQILLNNNKRINIFFKKVGD